MTVVRVGYITKVCLLNETLLGYAIDQDPVRACSLALSKLSRDPLPKLDDMFHGAQIKKIEHNEVFLADAVQASINSTEGSEARDKQAQLLVEKHRNIFLELSK